MRYRTDKRDDERAEEKPSWKATRPMGVTRVRKVPRVALAKGSTCDRTAGDDYSRDDEARAHPATVRWPPKDGQPEQVHAWHQQTRQTRRRRCACGNQEVAH